MSNDLVASADESETGESIVSLESMEHRPFRFLDLPTGETTRSNLRKPILTSL